MAISGVFWQRMIMWGWVALLVLGGCIQRNSGREAIPTLASSTEKSTAIVQPSPTIFPSSTYQPPTRTPLPTLLPDEAEALVLDLLETNGGCQLPCWWGIMPGETTWEQASHFLTTFMRDIYYEPNFNGFSTILPQSENIGESNNVITIGYMEMLIPCYDPDISNCEQRLEPIEIVETIQTSIEMSLSEALIEFNVPTEVRISIGPDRPGIAQLFDIVLFYPNVGIMMVFTGIPQDNGELLSICVDSIFSTKPRIWLWSPDEVRTFEDVGAPILFLGYSSQTYFPIEDVTELAPSSFYERFLDEEDGSMCFDMMDPY